MNQGLAPAGGMYEQYTTDGRSDGASVEDAREGTGARDGVCAAQDGAVGWADVCANDGLWLDRYCGGELCAVTARGGESGREGESAGDRATLRSGVGGIVAGGLAGSGGRSALE